MSGAENRFQGFRVSRLKVAKPDFHHETLKPQVLRGFTLARGGALVGFRLASPPLFPMRSASFFWPGFSSTAPSHRPTGAASSVVSPPWFRPPPGWVWL